MVDVRADLREYYYEEAKQRSRRPLAGRRVEIRDRFIDLLRQESRHSVVDFGAGPGWDAGGFTDAGHRYVGVDLAPENAALAAERGIDVLASSINAPPFATGSFDAGWSMSTIMHIPDAEMPQAVDAMMAVLAPAAPFMVGLWGGELGEHIDDTRLPGKRRLFCLRTAAQNRAFFELAATVEDHEVWTPGPPGWDYQLFLLRRP